MFNKLCTTFWVVLESWRNEISDYATEYNSADKYDNECCSIHSYFCLMIFRNSPSLREHCILSMRPTRFDHMRTMMQFSFGISMILPFNHWYGESLCTWHHKVGSAILIRIPIFGSVIFLLFLICLTFLISCRKVTNNFSNADNLDECFKKI